MKFSQRSRKNGRWNASSLASGGDWRNVLVIKFRHLLPHYLLVPVMEAVSLEIDNLNHFHERQLNMIEMKHQKEISIIARNHEEEISNSVQRLYSMSEKLEEEKAKTTALAKELHLMNTNRLAFEQKICNMERSHEGDVRTSIRSEIRLVQEKNLVLMKASALENAIIQKNTEISNLKRTLEATKQQKFGGLVGGASTVNSFSLFERMSVQQDRGVPNIQQQERGLNGVADGGKEEDSLFVGNSNNASQSLFSGVWFGSEDNSRKRQRPLGDTCAKIQFT